MDIQLSMRKNYTTEPLSPQEVSGRFAAQLPAAQFPASRHVCASRFIFTLSVRTSRTDAAACGSSPFQPVPCASYQRADLRTV